MTIYQITRKATTRIVIGLLLLIAILPLCGLWSGYEITKGIDWHGGSPQNLAITQNGIAFVTEMGMPSSLLSCSGYGTRVVDLGTQKPIKFLRHTNTGHIFAASDNSIYLLDHYALTLNRIDAANPQSVREITLPNDADWKGQFHVLTRMVERSDHVLLFTLDKHLMQMDTVSLQPKVAASFDSYISDMALVDDRLLINNGSKSQLIMDANDFSVKSAIQGFSEGDVNFVTTISDHEVLATHAILPKNGTGTTDLVVIDTDGGQVTKQLSVGSFIVGSLTISPNKVYVAQADESSKEYRILVYNPQTNSITHSFHLGQEPQLVHFPDDSNQRLAKAANGKVYVAYGNGFMRTAINDDTQGILIVDPDKDMLEGRIPLPVTKPTWEQYLEFEFREIWMNHRFTWYACL